jgi:peptidoglycan/LPS O-acetylase OafA/YrhL
VHLATRIHIPSLDGFRAIAVLLVFASHAIKSVAIPGRLGVTMFFFLSGYLITTLLRQEAEQTGTIGIRDFCIRRALRIVPPFLATFLPLIAALQAGWLIGTVRLDAILAAVLYCANYFMIATSHHAMPPGTGVLWSLAVEEHFYLFFPFLFALLRLHVRNGRRQALVLLGVCALVLAWRCALVFQLHQGTIERLRIATDTRIDSILFGCVLALHGNPMLDAPSHIPERVWKYWLFPLSVLVLLMSLLLTDDRLRETVRYSVQGLALYAVFVVAIRWPGWWLIRPLNWQAVRFLGALSYSFYLVHDIVIHQLEYRGAGDLERALIGLPVSVGLAWLVYVTIEKPLARWRSRWMATPRRHPGREPAS